MLGGDVNNLCDDEESRQGMVFLLFRCLPGMELLIYFFVQWLVGELLCGAGEELSSFARTDYERRPLPYPHPYN